MFKDTNSLPLGLDGLAASPGAGHPLGLSGADDDMHQSPVSPGAFIEQQYSFSIIEILLSFEGMKIRGGGAGGGGEVTAFHCQW